MHLQWYRDKGNGQIAADAWPEATQFMDGSWPKASIECDCAAEAKLKWELLLKSFGVNAETRMTIADFKDVMFEIGEWVLIAPDFSNDDFESFSAKIVKIDGNLFTVVNEDDEESEWMEGNVFKMMGGNDAN